MNATQPCPEAFAGRRGGDGVGVNWKRAPYPLLHHQKSSSKRLLCVFCQKFITGGTGKKDPRYKSFSWCLFFRGGFINRCKIKTTTYKCLSNNRGGGHGNKLNISDRRSLEFLAVDGQPKPTTREGVHMTKTLKINLVSIFLLESSINGK